MPGDVEDVAEALGRDHPHLGARVCENDVRGDRRAVEEVVDLVERHAGFLTEAANALDDAPRRVVRRRGHLVDGDAPRLLIDEDEIGEGPADVDADALHAVVLARQRTISRPTRCIWSI